MKTKTPMKTHKLQVRWMIRRDYHQVLEIDERCFDDGIPEDVLTEIIRESGTTGVVLERGREILGYMIYNLRQEFTFLERIAIDTQHQRQGLGTLLIDRLKERLSPQSRGFIQAAVDEYDVGSQLFFRNLGFLAIDQDMINSRSYYIMEFYP